MSLRKTGPDRRLSLLQAALDLFSTQGYDGTTTRAIALRVGVTEALLFKHFPTKQDLLRAVVEEFGPRRLFAPAPPSIHVLPAREALELFVTEYLDKFWANRAFMRMVFTTPKRDQAVFEELWAEFYKQGVSLYVLLQERIDRGELRPDSAAAATEVISSATSGFLQRSVSDEPPDWDAARTQFVTRLFQMLFDGLQVLPK